MYDARAICNFFIDRADAEGAPLTIMTLLKVLYFAHAWHLAKYDEPLVAQPFEAWKYGPVSRVVYDQFSEYKRKLIDKKAVSFDINSMSFQPTKCNLTNDKTMFLNNIFDYYSKFHPFHLSDLTHEPGGPWETVWLDAQKRAIPGMIIPNNLIGAWFKTSGPLYWTDRERSRPT